MFMMMNRIRVLKSVMALNTQDQIPIWIILFIPNWITISYHCYIAFQVWSMEKLEHKLIVMREMYDEKQNDPLVSRPEADPFYESQENHNLIGVANIFLDCLFHDVRLNYHIPIISQQGEVAGRLQVLSLLNLFHSVS